MNERTSQTTRRQFLKQGALTSGLILTGLGIGSCSPQTKKLPPEITAELKVTVETAPLTGHLTPELITRFELEHLEQQPAPKYQLSTTDGIDTTIHNYHPSAQLNPEGIYTAYEAYNRSNLAKIIQAIKEGTNPKDYLQNAHDPEEVYFLYRYSSGSNPIPVGMFSMMGAVKQRRMLIVSDDLAPNWSKPAPAITRQHIPVGGNAVGSLIQLTIVNYDRLLQMGEREFSLTAGMAVEIGQQAIKAISFLGGLPAGPGTLQDTIAQEGVCNTLGYAATLKRFGKKWPEVEGFLKNIKIGDIPGTPEPLKTFPLTEAAYSLLPSNGPLMKYPAAS